METKNQPRGLLSPDQKSIVILRTIYNGDPFTAGCEYLNSAGEWEPGDAPDYEGDFSQFPQRFVWGLVR